MKTINKTQTIKTEIESKKEELKNLKNKIATETKINDIKIGVTFSWDTLTISLSDTKTQWGGEYFSVRFTESRMNDDKTYSLSNSTGGWNEVSGDEQIETVLKIAEVLKVIKDNKEKYFNYLKELMKLDSKIYFLRTELEKVQKEEFVEEALNEGYKLYSKKELRKELLKYLGREVSILVADAMRLTKSDRRVRLCVAKINGRYKITENDDMMFLNTFIDYYSNKLIKGL